MALGTFSSAWPTRGRLRWLR